MYGPEPTFAPALAGVFIVSVHVAVLVLVIGHADVNLTLPDASTVPDVIAPSVLDMLPFLMMMYRAVLLVVVVPPGAGLRYRKSYVPSYVADPVPVPMPVPEIASVLGPLV